MLTFDQTFDMILIAHFVSSTIAVAAYEIVPCVKARNLTYLHLLKIIVLSVTLGWLLIVGLFCWHAAGWLMDVIEYLKTVRVRIAAVMNRNIFKD